MRIFWTFLKYNNDLKCAPWCSDGLKNIFKKKKVNTALQNLENYKVLLKDSVSPNEGPWLVMDPVGGSSCVPWVPWYDFLCLECKNMANIADFHLWAMIKDSETPIWLGLKPHWSSLVQTKTTKIRSNLPYNCSTDLIDRIVFSLT